MADNSSCPVCQDSFERPKLLQCGHTFCCKCIDISLESSRRTDEIRCPLCRKVTMCPKRKGESLMDNYFVTDHKKMTRIGTCAECTDIAQKSECEKCLTALCENCISLHMKNKCGGLNTLTQCDEHQNGVDEGFDDVNLEGQLISDHIQTKFYFDLAGKIVIPPEFSNGRLDGNLSINLSTIQCLPGGKVMVVPNGERFVLIYNSKGEEILRHALYINVIGITIGINGSPILIQNCENGVYEYSYGPINRIFGTQLHIPRAISSLNNGRLVTVGVKLEHSSNGFVERSNAALCIFEYHGQLVREVSEVNGEHLISDLTSICVNMKDNDIYVGDIKKKQILHFAEDGSYVAFFMKTDIPDMELGEAVTSAEVNYRTLFPLSLAYSQVNDLLFASYNNPIGNGIYVLSPNLTLVGLFYSIHDLGIPAGLSCDEEGSLYVGGGTDGIIRIFRLSQFKNKI
ncbi:hypothetical protein FSP39_000355 [Pinctada imbricata]|uniref:RING-type domain-containing protein n=1 Tax=Pinctada imbricata TaxID=66713 RepID=A0AA89BTQ0_PINIB|nr:hypothetical protein FSP39_000355 [Pinctada imbricata]